MPFVIQSLEKRLLCASTPVSPRADTLGATFDKSERQALLDRLTHLPSNTRSSLQTKLNSSVTQFDNALLGYFQGRSNAHFFFDPADAASYGDFIKNNNINYADIKANADAVADSHLFPDQSAAQTYTVDLPANINWADTSPSSNPEFIHALNRHGFWTELAWSSAIDGNAKYATELEYELASWSQKFTSVGTPSFFSATDQDGWLLDSSIRVESWVFAYFTLLDNAQFTSAEDSLFAYKLLQQGDFLYSNALTTTDYESNRTLTLAKGLLYLGELFPEIDNAAAWETTARDLLFKCMDNQLYQDGSHVEQSPGYTSNAAEDLLEARRLDELNGNTWPDAYKTKLSNAIDSYWQLLSPNSTRPAIGDTYRSTSFTLFLKADLIQGTSRWPAAKPRVRDVWLFGGATVTPYLNNPVSPALGNRGKTYPLENSGNYVMRSGNGSDANQVIFDAGPKGGVHGHNDLLNFELFGGGRPLISDPGAYKYDSSSNRAYVISTKAHNTLNADGANIGALEGNLDGANGSILVSQYDEDANHAQITASHWGYAYLAGQPVLTRSMWYDLSGTIIIVDWAEGNASHAYQQSFNLQTEGDTNNVTVDAANFTARTRYASGGNVKIVGLSRPGQTAAKGSLTFVTNTASGDYKDDAYRFTISQSGSFVCFVTLITAYDGTTAPNTTATLLNTPAAGGVVQVKLTKNGVDQQIDFTPPTLDHLNATATSRGTWNDVAYDKSGNLHLAYYDRDTKNLMYAVRSASNGKWSIPQIVDLPVSVNDPGEYQYISLALDNNGHPGIAYFDGWNGDLNYAYFDPTYSSWQITKIDSKGSTGLYPQLAYSRGNGAVISFYNRTKGDLMLAQSATGGYTLTAIDSTGDVGRFSSILLDPNRPDATKWAIGYEDTTNGNYKYAIQGLFNGGTQVSGYTNYTVDDLAIAGGYVSLAFYDSGTSDSKRYKPAMSYYDAANSALRYAKGLDSGQSWETQTVASKNIQGLYTQLFFDSNGKANIYYFNRSSNQAIRALLSKGAWGFTTLDDGGREIHVSLNGSGNVAYSNLDESVGELTVNII